MKQKKFKPEAEHSFWDEFFKNQIANKTEIIGDLKPIYFSKDQIDKANILQKSGQIHNSILLSPNHMYTLINKPELLMESKIVKLKELHKYFYHNYLTTCNDLFEFDFEVSKIDKLNVSSEEKFDPMLSKYKIHLYNEYSNRKLESFKIYKTTYLESKPQKNVIETSQKNKRDFNVTNSNRNFTNKLKQMKKDFENSKENNALTSNNAFKTVILSFI